MAPNARYFGFNPPFLGGPQNVLSLQTDERLIKNDIVQSILTFPGERVYRPTFGTNVRAAVFEQDTDDLEVQLRREIKSAIKRDERVTLDSITIERSPDVHLMNIRIIVRPTFDPLTKYVIEINRNFNPNTPRELLGDVVPRS